MAPRPNVGGHEAHGGGPRAVLLLVPALLALAAGRFPWGITRGDDMALLFGTIAAAVACWVLAAELRSASPALERLSAPLLGVALALALSTALASDRMIALFGAPQEHLGLVQVLALGALFLGAIVLAPDLRRHLPQALLVVFALQLGYGLWQLASGLNVRGTLPNSAYLGQTLLLAAPIVAAGVPQRARWRLAVPVISLVLLMLAGAAAPAALLLLWLALDLTGSRLAARTRTGILGAVTVGAWVLAPLASLVPSAAPTLAGRAWYWPAAFAEWLTSPVVGTGLGSLRGILYRRAPAGLFELESEGLPSIGGISPDPHNIVLAALVFGGLLAAGALVWLGIAAARAGAERLAADHDAEPYLHAALLCLATFAVQPAPIFTLPLLAVVAGAALGGVPAGGHSKPTAGQGRPAGKQSKRSQPLASFNADPAGTRVATMLVALVLALGIVGTVGSFSKAATYLYAGPIAEPMTQSAERAQRAADLWSVDHYLYYEASLRWGYLGVAGDSDAPFRERDAIDRACQLAPYEATYALARARVIRAWGGAEGELAAVYREAIELAPGSPGLRAEAASAGVSVP